MIRTFQEWNDATDTQRLEAYFELLGKLENIAEAHSHQCIKCEHPYTPEDGTSEDCPACGCDGRP